MEDAMAKAKVDEKVARARKALADRYNERGMADAAAAVKRGDWDGEPFMLALLDVLDGAK
jgi:hypothetical protein